MSTPAIRLTAIPGLPEIRAGDGLAALLANAVRGAGPEVRDGDVFVIAQKIVSKAEGRQVDLATVEASPEAERLALITDRDPRFVECVLRESDAVLRAVPGRLGVIVSDSFSRPWRQGVVNVAIGASALSALVDRRGHRDRHGRPLQVTQTALADAAAAAAGLVMGEADEGLPAVHLRGLDALAEGSRASDLLRPLAEDLFQ